MFKRILKILGICMAIGLVVLGAGFGIFALKGGFKDAKINIVRLYMDDTTKADSTVYTLEDFSTVINCEPLDATDKELEVIIQDPLRIEKNGKLEKEGILKNVPSTVMAGEEFKIQINKDANGNNYGGAVTLTFKPKNAGKVITDYTLKVIVDVVIPNKSLFFAGNNGDTYSTVDGKTITMGISNQEQFIYLKSTLVNAFYLEADNQNLKKVKVSYVYKNLNGELVENKTFDNLDYDRAPNKVDKEYNYFFKIPVTPKESGTITMTAQMHKTYAIQKEYEENGFDSMEKPDEYHLEAQTKLDKYNEFINKYISYFDTDDISYKFFKKHMLSDGSIKLPYEAVEESKKYIFQTTTSTINISAVNLKSIKSTDVPKTYKVFSSENFTINDMIQEFDLDITLSEENVAQENKEKTNLFSTLQVSPYIYLSKEEYLATKDSLWQNYGMILGVTGFTGDGKPEIGGSLVADQIEGSDHVGFLVALSGNNSYREYITSTLQNDASNKIWTLSFNTPLNSESSIKTARKALFLQFQVSGRNLNTNEEIVCNAYTRIYINYDEYTYRDANTAKITFSNVSAGNQFQKMTIYNNVVNATSQGYTSKLNSQTISIDLKNSISNYNTVQYKRVMYFVEQKSNQIDNGGSKLATVGSYKFKYMTGSQETLKRFDSEDDLIGERLLNEGTVENPEYVLRAINASNEPARIFAVVYLSDVNGNPIDVNGRPITINESIAGGEEPTLVVFAITETSSTGMASVQIDNFVSNINYYTISQIDHSISEEVTIADEQVTLTYEVKVGSFVKRDNVDNYVDPATGATFDKRKEEFLNFLKLKILSNNKFELYITNFELDEAGEISSTDTTNTRISLDVKDFYGKKIEGKTYDVNIYQNKQLALNNMAKDFTNEYTLNIQTTNASAVQRTIIEKDVDGNVKWIKFEILAEGKEVSNNGYIYLTANSNVVNSLNEDDNVNWEVNKLEINDIWLANSEDESYSGNSYLKGYEKLYSKYSEETSGRNQVFGNVKISTSDTATQFTPYYLYSFNSANDVAKGSIRDNVNYFVSSNLFSDGFVNSEINLNVVDMSQAIADATSSAGEGEVQSDIFTYKDIRSYLEYYTRETNSIEISYLSATGVAQLQSDLYFPSNSNDVILVGSKQFAIQQDNDGNRYILAGGREYAVTTSPDTIKYGSYVVKISKGEYFPLVNNNTVIICDEEFDIVSGLIYNIESGSSKRTVFKVTTDCKVNDTKYTAKNYIDDEENNSHSALEKNLANDGSVSSASIKFTKGGILKQGTKEVFEEDENGRYYLDTDGEYKLIETAGNNITRYAKKGIIAYLMITFKFTGLGDTVITKAIAYELIQEPTVLVATGSPDGKVVQELTTNSSSANRIEVQAGQDVTFALTTVGSVNSSSENYTVGIVGASYEIAFFKHCTFKIDQTNSARIKFVNGNYEFKISENSGEDIYYFKITIPDLSKEQIPNITISYKDENGNDIDMILGLRIIPNYPITIKEGSNVKKNDTAKCYELEVSAGSEIDINSLFNLDKGTLSLTVDGEYSQYARIDKATSTLVIGESFAYGTNTSSQKDEIKLTIAIIKDGNKTIEVDYKLVITIKPTYIVNFENLDGKNVLYGTNIFDPSYIEIYGLDSQGKYEKLVASDYTTALKNIGLKLNENESGVISSKIFENSTTKFTISWSEGLSKSATESYDVTINVIGFEAYYSADGAFNAGSSYDSMSEGSKIITGDYEWTLESQESKTLSDYFAVYSIQNTFNGTNIVPLFKKDETYYSKVGLVNGTFVSGEFNLLFASFNATTGEYTVLASTNIKVTVKKLEFFYSSGGNMFSLDYSSLISNNSYMVSNNITLDVSEDTLVVANYFKGFVNGFEKDNLTILLEDSTQNATSEVTVGESAVEYKLVYKIGDTKYYTKYTVTIKKNVSQ